MKYIIYCCLVCLLYSCTQHDQQVSDTPTYIELREKYASKATIDSLLERFKIDSNFKPIPDNRGINTYNYSISGSGHNGNSVHGDIEIRGKFGGGYIEDENGNEVSIDVEWTGSGTLEGIDENGNFYELEVD